jgi:hypothetical protein
LVEPRDRQSEAWSVALVAGVNNAGTSDAGGAVL